MRNPCPDKNNTDYLTKVWAYREPFPSAPRRASDRQAYATVDSCIEVSEQVDHLMLDNRLSLLRLERNLTRLEAL